MKKRVIIVHCWEGTPDYCWYPSMKKELENKGFSVEIPAFPETELPKMNKWVPYLQEIIKSPDEELYLVGHSIGCATIFRYLESLEDGEKIGGAVLVAGFTDNLGFKEIKNFFETPIDFKKIKSKVKKGIVAIHSDNDQYVDLKHSEIIKEKLGANIIIKHNAGHFSGSVDDEKACLELPEVVSSIEKISNN